MVVNISSKSMIPIGIVNRSLAEFDKSRSCQRQIFSIETLRRDLKSFAKEDTLSLLIGFFFTGTALLPICPLLKDSAISSISVRCKFLISIAILSNEVPINAIRNCTSANRSLGITCVAASIGCRSNNFATIC